MHGSWVTGLLGTIAVSILFYKGIVLNLTHDVYETTNILKCMVPGSGDSGHKAGPIYQHSANDFIFIKSV